MRGTAERNGREGPGTYEREDETGHVVRHGSNMHEAGDDARRTSSVSLQSN